MRLWAERGAPWSHPSALQLVPTSHFPNSQDHRLAKPVPPAPLAPKTEDPLGAPTRPGQEATPEPVECRSAREAAALCQPPRQRPPRAPRGRGGQIPSAHCITRPSPHPHATRPAAGPVPRAPAPAGAPSPPPPTYIIPLDEFDALLEAVGHAHGLELQSVHSGLSPGHLGSSGLRAARASAAATGLGARALFSAREALDSAPPPASPGLPASAPPPARLSRRGARGPSAGPCPGRDAGSGARGGCGTSEGEGKPSRAAEAASYRRVLLLLRRRLEAYHSAHPLYTEGERE